MRENAQSRGRRSSRLARILGVGLLVLGIVLASGYASYRWHNNPIRRAEQLIRSGRIVGMSKAQLDAWLGPSQPGVEWDSEYYLGVQRWGTIMPVLKFLEVDFDENDRVISAHIASD